MEIDAVLEFISAMAKVQEDLEKLQIPEPVFMDACRDVIDYLITPAISGKEEKAYEQFLKILEKQPPVKKKAMLLACIAFAHAAATELYGILYSEPEDPKIKSVQGKKYKEILTKSHDMPVLIGYVFGVTSVDSVSLVNELLAAVDNKEKKEDTEVDFSDPEYKLEVLCYVASGGFPLLTEYAEKFKSLTSQ